MNATDYLETHGISQETVDAFGLTCDDKEIHIPVADENGKLIFSKHRNLQFDPTNQDSNKYRYDSNSKAALFNFHAVKDRPYIVISEGEMDCMKLTQEGIPSVSSTGGSKKFDAKWAEWLDNKNVFICYDNDKAGKEGAKKVLELIPEAKIIELPEDSKDVCEFFAAGHTKAEFVQLCKDAPTSEEWVLKNCKEDYKIASYQELYDMEFPKSEWLIERMIPRTGITMVVGESGVGKSLFCLEIAKALASTDTLWGQFDVLTNGATLIIDKENGLQRLQKRLKGLDIPPEAPLYFLRYPSNFRLDNQEFMEVIAAYIRRENIKLVIFDSFVDVIIGSENSSEDTSKVFDSLRSLSDDISYLIVHHESKPQSGLFRSAGQKTRGSSNIIAQLDNQFYLQKVGENMLTVEQGKSRDGEAMTPFQLKFVSKKAEFAGFEFSGEVNTDAAKFEESKTQIVSILGGDEMKMKELTQKVVEAGISERTVRSAISYLLKNGLIKSRPDPEDTRKKICYVQENLTIDTD